MAMGQFIYLYDLRFVWNFVLFARIFLKTFKVNISVRHAAKIYLKTVLNSGNVLVLESVDRFRWHFC